MKKMKIFKKENETIDKNEQIVLCDNIRYASFNSSFGMSQGTHEPMGWASRSCVFLLPLEERVHTHFSYLKVKH